jgi:uncharacterized protein (DUF302 family)
MFAIIAKLAPAAILAATLAASPAAFAQSAGQAALQLAGDGVVRVKSAYPIDETIARLKKDIAAKGIRFFQEVDQHRLAADAGIKVRPSTLLVFGNPPLGTQFLNASAQAGLDWPVRLLVQEDEKGEVWAVYTDFIWIARRHGIKETDQGPFKTASGVIASITSSVRAQ